MKTDTQRPRESDPLEWQAPGSQTWGLGNEMKSLQEQVFLTIKTPDFFLHDYFSSKLPQAMIYISNTSLYNWISICTIVILLTSPQGKLAVLYSLI